MADRDREREEGAPGEVIILDKRHSRDVEAGAPEAPAAEPETAAPAPAEPPAAAPAPPQAPAASAADPAADRLPEPEEGGEEYFADDVAPGEMAYLRQVFSAGLINYLRSQLGLLLNFALLALGRAPDPATGLVAKNLAHARLAIDLLEQIVVRLEGEMQAAEKVQMKALVSDLKYAYMQAATAEPPGPVSA